MLRSQLYPEIHDSRKYAFLHSDTLISHIRLHVVFMLAHYITFMLAHSLHIRNFLQCHQPHALVQQARRLKPPGHSMMPTISEQCFGRPETEHSCTLRYVAVLMLEKGFALCIHAHEGSRACQHQTRLLAARRVLQFETP